VFYNIGPRTQWNQDSKPGKVSDNFINLSFTLLKLDFPLSTILFTQLYIKGWYKVENDLVIEFLCQIDIFFNSICFNKMNSI
jgi:hypothetical protein